MLPGRIANTLGNVFYVWCVWAANVKGCLDKEIDWCAASKILLVADYSYKTKERGGKRRKMV